MDDFDSGGVLSNSSEAYADIAAIYRYQASCVGFGFFWTSNEGCGQTADGTGFNANESQTGTHCDTNCSGVRDADWARHNPNTPDTPQNYVCGQCVASSGPCGRQVHCAAAPTRQAAWDLVSRDLRAAPFNYDSNTAFMIGNKIFYQGSGNVGLWHACDCTAGTSNGCGSANGYIQWLTADDDNGNLNDGTPHMTAIYAAFNRHNIACGSPVPVNSGCSGAPTGVATVNATPGDAQVSLSWNAVAGASKYWVLRTEGHAGCDFGKVNLTPNGIVSTFYNDTQVLNGRTYYYNVVAVGSSNACFGPASTCISATPTSNCSLPAAPVNQSPANGATNLAVNVNLDWTDVGGAISYDVEVATDAAFTNIIRSSNVVSSNWSVSPDLSYSSTYYWHARANNSCDAGPFSTPFSFTTSVPPPGVAVYDPVLKTPKCATVNPYCDSTSLLDGRDSLGPEPNQPNTINNSCADGSSGGYHADESNDRIKVSTLDNSNLTEGKTVKIEATVWAWTTPSSDALDLYYAANANSPSWTFITTMVPTIAGPQTLSVNYTLPAGSLQAVRARFRYTGSAAACGSGSYDDHDDLIFAVGTGGCTLPPAPALVTPSNGATGVATSPLLDWSDVAGATSYNVRVCKDAACTSVVTASPASSQWYISPKRLTGTLYYWSVRTVNSCGTGPYGAARTFTTSNQLLLNPGFESGNVNWTSSPATGIISTGTTAEPSRSGNWRAKLGGKGASNTTSLYQQVSIPGTATAATLNFYQRTITSETTTTLANDKLMVEVLSTTGAIRSTLVTYSNLNKSTTYVLKSLNLLAFKGNTIRIRFRAVENASLKTTFLIDDVAQNITINGNPSIVVIAPNGGETWTQGSVRSIKWTSWGLSQSGQIVISYWINNAWTQIAGPLPATATSWNWTVPNTPTTTSKVLIRSLVNNVAEASDESDFATLKIQ